MVSPDIEPQVSIVVVCGPTGSGKGSLARELARRCDGEIISADSRKIYRGFDIGTAKPTHTQRALVEHHLIDCCDPEQLFSAAKFVDAADKIIAEIKNRNHNVFLVGGTGLYIRALLHGIVDTPSRDEKLRADLLDIEVDNPGALYQQLALVDPVLAKQLKPSDMIRIVRALEVYKLCGRPLSEFQADHGFNQRRYPALLLSPNWERKKLYQRINSRVEHMLKAGLLEEVKSLLARGLGECRAFKTVGYRELKDHLAKKLTYEEAVEKIKTEHRRYSRRQVVWFKGIADLKWLPTPVDLDQVSGDVKRFLT
ncbi:MAG: tRNA (adenosine(37)-N6)-dimethylallyltransferase MiaA [Deltaproteobacteria bacterium]|nr:tRNA (adenosine(37)-N6)-dimethylallyltransferase MiaA [Deltaproteobacteria bacterium]